MNNLDRNAQLTVYSREQIVVMIESGQTAAEVAAAFGFSVKTERKLVERFRWASLQRSRTTHLPKRQYRDGIERDGDSGRRGNAGRGEDILHGRDFVL